VSYRVQLKISQASLEHGFLQVICRVRREDSSVIVRDSHDWNPIRFRRTERVKALNW